jgi:hypothetical protein
LRVLRIAGHHLVGLVEKGDLRGYGHQQGNLVPCCSRCNSAKGSKDWQQYLCSVSLNEASFDVKRAILASYLERYAAPVDLAQAATLMPVKWARFRAIKREIFSLMAEADLLAPYLRTVVVAAPDPLVG